MKRLFKGYSQAYLLPSTILLGLAISIASGTFLAFTAMSSQTLNRQNYTAMAEEAARSGIAYADSCLTQSHTWQPKQLKPNTNCDGVDNASGVGSPYVTVHGSEWRSRFVVTQNTTEEKVTSKGYVDILDGRGGVAVTFEKELNMSAGEAFDTYPTSTGRSITDIKNDGTDCAIANGSLYCWGDNSNGQVGDGSGGLGSSKNTPTRVGGALANKTVTSVSVSDSSVCAIGDGKPYCWGGNGVDQLGNDLDGKVLSKDDVWAPREDIPRTSSGPLKDYYVTDIGTASANNPAGAVWIFATSLQHSCGLRADGAATCWGYGGFRQQTGGGCVLWALVCLRYSYPSNAHPTLVKGYRDDTGPFAGKKAVRIGASSHDSCIVANGEMYCWGVPAPLYAGPQIICSTYTGVFSDANITLWPANPCVASYSNGYSATNALFSQMQNKHLDPKTFDVSSNEGCMMADRNFYCFGTTPAFGPFWTSSFRAPWVAIANSDVTSADNGDLNDLVLLGGLSGLYCVVDRGVPKCAGSLLNGWTGTGHIGDQSFRPLLTNNFSNQVATKIAAGKNHGCVVANGRLYCWGDGGSGRLASGGSANAPIPKHTGTGGTTPIGTAPGEFAAHGSISTGDGHSCGIANGKVFCWGRNNQGQLGMSNTTPLKQPRSVPALVNKAATKVSAGREHTCAIVEGSLYCWGSNANGQLGLGTTAAYETVPQIVNGHGALTTSMRVTDVSTSDDNTCAVANARVFCWGNNSAKQIGDGSTTLRRDPVLVSGGANILNGKSATAVSIGKSHACAIANADLYCWGSNANGRTGLGPTNVSGNANPTLVNMGAADTPRGPNDKPGRSVLPSVSAVSAGSDFTCAIFNAKLACWGSNANGRTGRGVSSGDTTVPTAITGAAAGYFATTVSAGRDHACALLYGNNSKTNGSMYCWGKGDRGQLGYNALSDRSSVNAAITSGSDMVEGGELRSATSISAGGSTSCAIANAVMLCWGDNSNGQLGNGGAVAIADTPVKTLGYQVRSTAYARGPVY